MRSYRNLALALTGTLLLHGELAQWVQHIEAGSPLDAIFFRTVTLPGGPVPSRRPPRETIPEITRLIQAEPTRKDLLALRAHESELQMNFEAAEADWKAHGDPLALADFYARRNNGRAEFDALLRAAQFDRAKSVAEVHALGIEALSALYKAWISRHPERTDLVTEYANTLIAAKRYAEAEALPGDATFKVRTRAAIAEAQGSAEKARAIYDQSFQPLWPPQLVADYFGLMNRTRSLRAYLANARAAVAKDPTALEPAARIFYYWQQAGNLPQAHRALLELRLRKSKWTPQELITVAKLFEQTHNYPEAARHFFEARSEEQGLAGLIRVLLTAPEQPIRIGSEDLTYYRDIATIDSHPGFLNGILSLLFNSTDPGYQFSSQELAAVPYFHRAKAAELLAEFDKRFPSSAEREALHAGLIEAYGAYAENGAVLAKAQQFLAAFPKSAQRTRVSLATADAYARMNRGKEEFAVYDAILKELGSSSPEYLRVLDRYLGRLVAEKRIKQAIALYRTEIDRNPNDPALYDRLAKFLDENQRGAEIEDVYRRATKQFADRSWHHKLARWYLRQNQRAQFAALTREVASIFSGTDLEAYFQQVVAGAGIDSAMYRQVNLYAHQRFPHDMQFVKNLVEVYRRRETRDDAAVERLLRLNWYHDGELRARFFELLSRTGRLEGELLALGKMPALTLADRVATEFIAEAQIWRCHYEAGAPSLQLTANNFTGDVALNDRAASLSRSLGQIDAAVRFASRIQRLQPGNFDAIARIGDIHADQERFDQARPLWNAMPAVRPGDRQGFLDAATIYWDYFLYDDALRVIEQGRKQLGRPTLFAYEAGAIRESQRDYKRAISEYIVGAIAEPDSAARRRLLRLASRPAHKGSIEAALAANPNAFALRVAVLEDQDRRADLSALLSTTASSTSNLETLSQIGDVAARLELNDVRVRVFDRQIALSPDPVEKLRLGIAAARLVEQQKDISGAERRVAALYRENPAILGVVRATTDFYWRNKQGSKAVDTLEQSAAKANAEYKRKLTLEAARKATEIEQYARARKLLDPLLASEPTAADLIAATADTYARAGDTTGMRAFLVERLKLTTGETQAQLRRTLIPVLTGIKDYTGAVDQYIELLNRYSEDQSLIAQATDYAREHKLTDRLVNYYVKTSTDAPRDARWPALLARIHRRMDRHEDAIPSYTRALGIRPDRTDLLQERAQSEQRLLRFDEASRTYARLYELTHRNPRWMVKSAEMRARLGDKDGAVRGLRTAFLENLQPRAQEYFEIARTLEQWSWLAEAKQFAEEGLKLYQPATAAAFDQLSLYMRVSTRVRQHEAAYASVLGRLPEGVTPDRLLYTAAEVVRSHFTPEEKQSFARWLEANTPAGELRAGIAQSAGVVDVAVRALHEELTANPEGVGEGRWRRLGDLQQRRMQYAEFAGQLESYWRKDGQRQGGLIEHAARLQRVAGNFKDEIRLLGLIPLSGDAAQRYADVLRATAPQRLVELAGPASYLRDAAVESAMEGNDAELALKTVGARGQGRPPVWTSAHTALIAVYFKRPTDAFDALLGPRTVGEQVTSKPDMTRQLAGDDWFPYAARYGEHTRNEDFVIAEIEGRPYTHTSYFELGEWRREQRAYDAAVTEYRRALQINPKYAEAYTRIGDVLAAQGNTAAARAEWVRAVETWHAMQNGRLPESFWSGVAALGERLGRHKSLDELLSLYIRRNGQHRVDQLVEPLIRTAPDAAQFVIELSKAAQNPSEFAASLARATWMPKPVRNALYQHLAQTTGEPRYRTDWIGVLVESGRYAEALALIDAFSADSFEAFRWTLKPLQLRAAAETGSLAKALDDPELMDDEIQRALQMGANDVLLEVLYERQQNQLGLADLRLKAGNVAAAMELIERLPHEVYGDAAALLERQKRPQEALQVWQTRLRSEPWDMAAKAAVARLTNDSAALQRLATDASAPYAARVAAAGALRGVSGLGSRELDVLAAGNTIEAKEAEQPYFFHARLQAATQTTDPATKVRLLRSALGIDPDASAVRPMLFRAAIAAGQPSVSIATWYPLLIDSAVGHWLQTPQPFTGRARYIADQFLSASGLDQPDRGEVARDMAGSYVKLGQPRPALVLLQVARELGTNVDIAVLEQQIARDDENRRRRPVINEGVRQPHRVRPRIEGGAQ